MAESRRKKFNFCRLPFAVNVMLKLFLGGIPVVFHLYAIDFVNY